MKPVVNRTLILGSRVKVVMVPDPSLNKALGRTGRVADHLRSAGGKITGHIVELENPFPMEDERGQERFIRSLQVPFGMLEYEENGIERAYRALQEFKQQKQKLLD